MSKNNVLIIDDSPVDRKIMSRILEKANETFTISFNNDGEGVEEQIIKEKIDTVILDLMIENINGVDILSRLKNNDLTCDIPIIICSSVSERETVKKTLNLGAYDYFEKPLTKDAIEFGFAVKVKNAVTTKLKTDHVKYLTNHDVLTGLRTRRFFETQLHDLCHSGEPNASIVIVDINGLKVINDAYGHDVGNQVLIETGKLIQASDRYGVLAARWGSDEIAVLIPGANNIEAVEIATEIKNRVDREKSHNYDISLGWATATRDRCNPQQLIQEAEDNLYSNKVMDSSSVRSNMIESIIHTLHQKNPREEKHSHRVSFISAKIAITMGLSDFEVKRIQMAGLMHDIGKIGINEEILNKPGKLDDKEWQAVRKHPEFGFKILSTSVDTMEIAKAVLAHHERWDGKGYPYGKAGEEIPLMARIITVADTFDAMTSSRTYRTEVAEQESMEEIVRCSGSQFDPMVVEAFVKYMGF